LLKKDKAMLVKFWGVRGSIPCPGPTTCKYGGNTACIELRFPGTYRRAPWLWIYS